MFLIISSSHQPTICWCYVTLVRSWSTIFKNNISYSKLSLISPQWKLNMIRQNSLSFYFLQTSKPVWYYTLITFHLMLVLANKVDMSQHARCWKWDPTTGGPPLIRFSLLQFFATLCISGGTRVGWVFSRSGIFYCPSELSVTLKMHVMWWPLYFHINQESI